MGPFDLDGASLFSSLLMGTVGFAMLIYGKKAERGWWFVGGLAMCVFPYMVHSVLLMWLGAGGCVAGAAYMDRST